jgi:uncharacterized protein with HEPN domain
MRPDRLLLADILDAIDEVLDVTPASRAEFDAGKLVRSHVVRHIQIIGEAVTRLSAEVKEPTSRSIGTPSMARRRVMCPRSGP